MGITDMKWESPESEHGYHRHGVGGSGVGTWLSPTLIGRARSRYMGITDTESEGPESEHGYHRHGVGGSGVGTWLTPTRRGRVRSRNMAIADTEWEGPESEHGYHRHEAGGSRVGTWLSPKVQTFEGSVERTLQSLELICSFDMFSAWHLFYASLPDVS